MAIRIWKGIAVGLIAISSITVAACSSNTASPNAAAGGNARSTSVAKGASDVNTCSLLPLAQASSLVGKKYTSATPSTIATGQDQCSYDGADGISFLVIIYQPNSGVTLQMLSAAESGAPIAAGVGDKAVLSQIELDVQTGDRLIAVQGAGGTGDDARAIAVAKAIIAALH